MSQESSKKMASGPKPVTNVHGVRFLGLNPKNPKSTRVTRSSVFEIAEEVLEDVSPLQHLKPEGSTKKKRAKNTPKKKKSSIVEGTLEEPTVTIEAPEKQSEYVNEVIKTVLNDVLETPLMSIPVEDVGPDVPTTRKEANDVPISNLNADDGVDVDIDGDHSNQEEINPAPVTVTPASPVVSQLPSIELVNDVYVSPSPTVNPEEPAVEEEVHELVDDEGTESEDYVLARVLSEKKKKSTQVQVPAKKKKDKEKKKAFVEEVTPQKKSVKRKRRDGEESYVEPDVSDIDTTARKRMSGRRVPRRVSLERELVLEALGCQEVLDLIAAAGLMKTVTGFGRSFDKLVKEFVVNITPDCNMAGSAKYKKITAEQVKSWPKKGMLSTGTLSVKYALLNRIGAANWLPTNHFSHISIGLAKLIYLIGTKTPFDFGAFVFEQTIKHAYTLAVKFPIAFRSLISEIILSQHPKTVASDEYPLQKAIPLTFDPRLYVGPHVQDNAVETDQARAEYVNVSMSPADPGDVLAELMEVFKTLQDTIVSCTQRKKKFDLLIKRLTMGKASVVEDGIQAGVAQDVGTSGSDSD
ncbi:uncharacterized protein LOC130712854 [Lotus japonicus]|uniref:uncharacterized protein LOC130712854 n=1 Tax=Lotus japonicus TaxID=34305 RepID=UPI00258A21F3|nr:uncharacterized protein LOC130712854 [Lotus japonicus]